MPTTKHTAAKTPRHNHGRGYRWVRRNEKLRDTDEFSWNFDGVWQRTSCGGVLCHTKNFYRRKVSTK